MSLQGFIERLIQMPCGQPRPDQGSLDGMKPDD
jgi:hypothetical protein